MKNFSRKSIIGLMLKNLPTNGRTNTGQLALYHRGGGLSLRYRLIDFKRSIWNMAAIVVYNEYDPKRTSFLSLIIYSSGILSYILATEGINAGETIFNSSHYFDSKIGNFLPIIYIPEGNSIHSLEVKKFCNSRFMRAAGTKANLIKKFYKIKKILLRLPSKEEVLVNDNFFAVMGRVSNSNHKLEKVLKAGFNILKGFRPKVRGVAKNPVDHPHGGGGGRHLVNRWSFPAKNILTRKVKENFVFSVTKSRKIRKNK
jgi:large subunit ribosomal protein L2